MHYRVLADLTLGAHLLFIVYVLAGGLLAYRIRWLAAPHLACVAWGLYVELAPGAVCPLTPLENRLLLLAGREGYADGFIEHYLLPILYPEALTPEAQWVLAALVILINALVYGAALQRARRRRAS
ncbi:MAG: DUF2784 domain-containing protein [Vicinamibacteria bacterium]